MPDHHDRRLLTGTRLDDVERQHQVKRRGTWQITRSKRKTRTPQRDAFRRFYDDNPMFNEWISTQPSEVGMVLLSAGVTYGAILLFTRVAGLRSFSKMSAADFAMTVAVGSLFASTISSAKPSLMVGIAALASLFAGQWALAYLRKQSDRFSKIVDNEPLLLLHGATILHDNVTTRDLFGKLREANARNYSEVLAVVFETTGDISVLHSSDADARLERDFFSGVIDADRIENFADDGANGA